MLALNGATFDAVLEAATEALDEAIEMGGDCERVAAPKLHQVAISTGPVDAVRSIEMLRTLAEMIDKLYFAGTCHSGAVATRASDVAVRLGVPEALVSQIRLAGEFHDIGRALLTPDLFTTQVPTDAERRLVQTHVVLGARLVSNTGFEDAAECIAGMHERWDGSGQPLGQSGVVIPLGARILAAANAFETVLGGHGRGDRGLRAAVTAVVGARGQSLDPQVVDSLLASLRASMDSAA
jgi:HD-GYP domain-containing protein (c-di-GMP phosphodiesterase class II)